MQWSFRTKELRFAPKAVGMQWWFQIKERMEAIASSSASLNFKSASGMGAEISPAGSNDVSAVSERVCPLPRPLPNLRVSATSYSKTDVLEYSALSVDCNHEPIPSMKR